MTVPAPELPDGPWAQSVRLAFRFIFGLVLAAALAWPFSNIRQVAPGSRAVVLRLGRVTRVQDAGLLLAWPKPFEQVVSLPGPDRQIEFSLQPLAARPAVPLRSAPDWVIYPDPRANAGFFLTADGVVHLTATLFYWIDDPAEYMLESAHVEPALVRLAVASLAALASARDTDAVFVTWPGSGSADPGLDTRERLRSDLLAAVNRRLAGLRAAGAGLGVEVSRIDIGAALPRAARQSFDQALVATQAASQLVAEARSYANTAEQRAERDRNQLLAGARAAAEERKSAARVQTAEILAFAGGAGPLARASLLDRIYHERIAAVLRRAGAVDVIDPETGRLILPGRAP